MPFIDDRIRSESVFSRLRKSFQYLATDKEFELPMNCSDNYLPNSRLKMQTTTTRKDILKANPHSPLL